MGCSALFCVVQAAGEGLALGAPSAEALAQRLVASGLDLGSSYDVFASGRVVCVRDGATAQASVPAPTPPPLPPLRPLALLATRPGTVCAADGGTEQAAVACRFHGQWLQVSRGEGARPMGITIPATGAYLRRCPALARRVPTPYCSSTGACSSTPCSPRRTRIDALHAARELHGRVARGGRDSF